MAPARAHAWAWSASLSTSVDSSPPVVLRALEQRKRQQHD
jgi:hypothetical protein